MKPNLLITGASSGVGRFLTHQLSDRFHVIAVARRMDRLKEEFSGITDVEYYKLDLGNPGEVDEFLDGFVKKHEYIPYLINNAGINVKSPIDELDDKNINQSFQVNAFSPIRILKRFLPRMKGEKFGRVINLTSGAPLNCFPGYSAYSASKGALNAFTVTAAKECAEYNIKINLMSPGPVRTEMAPDAPMDVSACKPTVEYLLNLKEDGPTGKFFWLGYEIPLFPNLEGIRWLEGKADERYRRAF